LNVRAVLALLMSVVVMSGDTALKPAIETPVPKRSSLLPPPPIVMPASSELHRLAAGYLRQERPDHTLQPSALINEAYIRLAGNGTDWQNHQHFIGVAANIMRRVLVDHARAHNAGKRGGDLRRVEFEEGVALSPERSVELIDVDDALTELQALNSRQAQIGHRGSLP